MLSLRMGILVGRRGLLAQVEGVLCLVFFFTMQVSSWSFGAVALMLLGTSFVSAEPLHWSRSAMAALCGDSFLCLFVMGMAVDMSLFFGFGCW